MAGLAVVAIMPAATGLILQTQLNRAWARVYFVAAWALAAAMLAVQSGGAASPITAVFVLAPAYAVAVGGGDAVYWASALSAGGFLAASALGQGPVAGLGAAPVAFGILALLLAAPVLMLRPTGVAPRRIAELAHEWRTPLNHMIGFAEMIQNQALGPLDRRYAEYGALIASSGRRLVEMLSRQLDFARSEAGPPLSLETFDVRAAAEEALLLARGSADPKGVVLAHDLPAAPVLARADPGALRQILANLLGNAVKYTPPGGRVTLAARADSGGAVLEVCDTGPGIAAADRERLMRPFERGAGGEGAGLGLALVRTLAERQGGAFSLAEAPGGGLLARVRLPAG
jgi:signal transduction histidine kinase